MGVDAEPRPLLPERHRVGERTGWGVVKEDCVASTVQIGNRIVGDGFPTLVIAEIGVNHQGRLDLALELVRAAVNAGADAVKFQKRDLESVYTRDVLEHTEKYERPYQYLIPILREVELSEKDYHEITRVCRDLGMMFLCTPFDVRSADFVDSLGVPAFKVASADLTHTALLDHLSSKGKPLIVSTGASFLSEIEHSVAFLKERKTPFVLLHCNTSYPTGMRDVNLRVLQSLRQFGVPVGYSGHESGHHVPVAAVALGACMVEKHMTSDRTLRGPDHRASLEPGEFRSMVQAIRDVEQAMGSAEKRMTQGELMNREILGKSLVARCAIQKGITLTHEMIAVKSPAKGLSPQRLQNLLGRTTRRPLEVDDYFIESDLDEAPTEFLECIPKAKWGLVVRFADAPEAVKFGPKVLEYHLTARDVDYPYTGPHHAAELVVHAPEYEAEELLDLASTCEKRRCRSVDFTHRVLGLAHRMSPFFHGRAKVIVHPGGMSQRPLSTHQRQLQRRAFQESFRDLRRQANRYGLILLPENLPPLPWYFGGEWCSNVFCDEREISEFIQSEQTDICLDISHAQLQCAFTGQDLQTYIQPLRPHVTHLHIADARGVNGEGIQIDEGDVHFDRVMNLFTDYRESWVPEIWKGHLDGNRGFIVGINRLSRYWRDFLGAEELLSANGNGHEHRHDHYE